ncbi:MAG TPA: sugar nucleotide-binding protein [Gemmataceae bacterium]|nr:sugar nucleotide-binding protein [Gemmataceae bacterium]
MSSFHPARVLVLGGAGMLGHMLVRHLRECSSLDVRFTTRRGEDEGTPFDVQGEPEGLPDLLARLAPLDFIINCIAVLQGQIDEGNDASVELAHKINSEFPHRLAEIAGAHGCRILHVSTDGVFAADAGLCVESTPAAPPNVYGRTKLHGEVRAAHALNIRCSLIGPASANGRGLWEWLRRQPPGARISGFTDHLWTGCTTRQFAELCRCLIVDDLFTAAAHEGSVHHFCPCEPLSKYELLSRLAELLRPDIEVCPTASGRPVSRQLDTQKQALHRAIPKYAPLDPALRDLATEFKPPRRQERQEKRREEKKTNHGLYGLHR